MSLSSAPNLDRVATESARSRLTQAGRSSRAAHSPTTCNDLPPRRASVLPSFAESQLLSIKRRCRSRVVSALRAKGAAIRGTDSGRTDRGRPERIAGDVGAENYDEGGEICAALANRRRIPPSVSHAVSPVLHLSRAQLSPLLLLLITPSICPFHTPFHEVVPP